MWPLIIIAVIIVLYWRGWFGGAESYRPCRDCDGRRMAANGTLVINPFVWPYSGTQCVDALYMKNRDNGLDIGSGLPPPRHLNTPDHTLLTE